MKYLPEKKTTFEEDFFLFNRNFLLLGKETKKKNPTTFHG